MQEMYAVYDFHEYINRVEWIHSLHQLRSLNVKPALSSQ